MALAARDGDRSSGSGKDKPQNKNACDYCEAFCCESRTSSLPGRPEHAPQPAPAQAIASRLQQICSLRRPEIVRAAIQIAWLRVHSARYILSFSGATTQFGVHTIIEYGAVPTLSVHHYTNLRAAAVRFHVWDKAQVPYACRRTRRSRRSAVLSDM